MQTNESSVSSGSEASESQRIQGLLDRCRRGDRSALDTLYELLYDELRVVARRHLREWGDGAGETLNTTALVHESYLKVAGGGLPRGRERAQFFAVASQAMRSVLVDCARRRMAAKRGGGEIRVTLHEGTLAVGEAEADLLVLDDALERLERKLPRLARVVECRFFGGMSAREISDALDVSVRTVERDWTRARAYLMTLLEGGADGETGGSPPSAETSHVPA
jgi:RNA polymerase sigma factor (TIGR02999 family)